MRRKVFMFLFLCTFLVEYLVDGRGGRGRGHQRGCGCWNCVNRPPSLVSSPQIASRPRNVLYCMPGGDFRLGTSVVCSFSAWTGYPIWATAPLRNAAYQCAPIFDLGILSQTRPLFPGIGPVIIENRSPPMAQPPITAPPFIPANPTLAPQPTAPPPTNNPPFIPANPPLFRGGSPMNAFSRLASPVLTDFSGIHQPLSSTETDSPVPPSTSRSDTHEASLDVQTELSDKSNHLEHISDTPTMNFSGGHIAKEVQMCLGQIGQKETFVWLPSAYKSNGKTYTARTLRVWIGESAPTSTNEVKVNTGKWFDVNVF